MNNFDKMKLEQIHYSIIDLANTYEYNEEVLLKLMKYYNELYELRPRVTEKDLFNKCIYSGALNILLLAPKNKKIDELNNKFINLII